MTQKIIARVVRDHTACIETSFIPQTAAIAGFSSKVVDRLNRGGRLLVAGSGPLSALADMVANLFLYRLGFDRPPLPAVPLGSNGGLAHALAREGLQAQYWSRQVRALGRSEDIFLALADGHRDDALLEGLQAARQAGCLTALLVPAGQEPPEETPDAIFSIATDSPARLHEGALFFGQLLCELVEAELFGI